MCPIMWLDDFAVICLKALEEAASSHPTLAAGGDILWYAYTFG